MSTAITYDTFEFTGSNGFPTPFISRSQTMLEYGNRWGQGTSFTLNGQINATGFSDLLNKQNILLSGFSRDFKSLNITEDGENVAGFPASNCKINNISFDANKYVNILDYSIDINTYDETLFSGTFGVLNPSDQISFQESQDGTISVSHQVSAQGFPANNKSSIENAKDFVHSQTGWRNSIDPYFIQFQKYTTKYDSDFSSSEDGWSASEVHSFSYSQTIGGLTNTAKYIANTNENESHFINKTFDNIIIGKTYKLTAKVYINDHSLNQIDQVEIAQSATNGDGVIVKGGARGEWRALQSEFVATSETIWIKAKDSDTDYGVQGDSSQREWFAVRDILIEEYMPFTPILNSQSENVNRIDGTYSVDENYSIYTTGINNLYSGFSVTVSSGINSDYISVGLEANYKGYYKEDISEVRNKIPSLTSTGLYPIAKELSEISDLNSGALNFSISENSGQSSIAVNCSFDNTPFYDGSNAFFDYNISFNTNELTSQTNTVVNGAINVLGSNRKDKLRIAEEFLDNTINSTTSGGCNHEAKYVCYLYSLANEEYNRLGKGYTLAPFPTTCSLNKNSKEGIIELSASFNDKYQPSQNVKDSSWEIQVTPPLRTYLPFSDVVTHPKHIFFNTNVVNRSTIRARATAASYDSVNQSYGLTTVESFITNTYNTYVNTNSDIYEQVDNLSFDEKNLNYNKEKTWSFHNDTEWVKLPSPSKP